MQKTSAVGLRSYIKLTKIRLSAMNAAMTVAGYYTCAPVFEPFTALTLFTGNLLMASSSQIIGQIIERDKDALMNRTKNRPLPSKEITVTKAKALFVGTWLGANLLLWPISSPSSIFISNIIIPGYLAYIYTKPRTKLCVYIGSVIGMMPILAGGLVPGVEHLNSKLLFDLGFMYNWQMVHFIGILQANRKDYNYAGFKMPEGDISLWLTSMVFLILQMALVYYLFDKDKFHIAVKTLLEFLLLYKTYELTMKLRGHPIDVLQLTKGKGKFLFGRLRRFKGLEIYLMAFLYYFVYNLKKPSSGPSEQELTASNKFLQPVATELPKQSI